MQLITEMPPPLTPDEKNQRIDMLAKLSTIEYEAQRESEASVLEMRARVLDDEVKKRRTTGDVEDELVSGVQPWSEPVDGRAVATEVLNLFRRYCVLPQGAEVALTLWCMATFSIDQFRIFPKACLSSPDKRCGKTTTLEVMNSCVDRAMMVSNLTSSVMFRAIEAWRPTLLIDEADTFLQGNDELRGIINSGHTKNLAFVLRVEGDAGNRYPAKFSTWTPMCIAMIRTPPDTIRDRSILVGLRRKKPTESVEKLPLDLSEECTPIRRKLRRWSDDNACAIRSVEAHVPTITNERAMDNWLPLFSVAQMLGQDWTGKAIDSFLNLESSNDSEDECVGVLLLRDIGSVFHNQDLDRISSAELVTELIAMEDRPWGEWQGKPLTQNKLAALLRPYKIRTENQRHSSGVQKGYSRKLFEDAFERYIPAG